MAQIPHCGKNVAHDRDTVNCHQVQPVRAGSKSPGSSHDARFNLAGPSRFPERLADHGKDSLVVVYARRPQAVAHDTSLVRRRLLRLSDAGTEDDAGLQRGRRTLPAGAAGALLPDVGLGAGGSGPGPRHHAASVAVVGPLRLGTGVGPHVAVPRRDGTPNGGWAFRHGPDFVAGDKFKLVPVLHAGVLLMGRRTWQPFSRLWPHRTDEFSAAMNRIPKLVVSHAEFS